LAPKNKKITIPIVATITSEKADSPKGGKCGIVIEELFQNSTNNREK